jgi:A/G-specific adenine glycosylase
VQNQAVLLHQAAANARRLAEIHELPTADQLGMAEAALRKAHLIAVKRRGITRFQITESIYVIDTGPAKLPAELSWVPLASLQQVTLSGPHRRWVNEILAKLPGDTRNTCGLTGLLPSNKATELGHMG